jgi:acetyl-CoA synthetase
MSNNIDNLMHEDRRFPPTAEFAAQALGTAALYEEAQADRLGFWARQAKELLSWSKPFTRTLDWSEAPIAKWFDDGELNVAFNCLDRHVLAGNGDRVALYGEGEPGDQRVYTYAELTESLSTCP